jgi:hypothetical protein
MPVVGDKTGGAEYTLTTNLFVGDVLRLSQFGGGVGIAPVAVGVVRVKTGATILVTTLNARVDMVAAEILIATETRAGGRDRANRTELRLLVSQDIG